MHSAAAVVDAYRRTEVESRSPLELVVMLYDGANRYLSQARDAIERHDSSAKHEAISRALAVVSELQNTLNIGAGGEIATSLDSLYTFVSQALVDANVNDSVDHVDQALRVLVPLRDAWSQLATVPTEDAIGGLR